MSKVLLIPGLACDAELFAGQAPVLAACRSLVVADAHMRLDTIPAIATALLAEHAGPLVAVGCSMGGMVAMEMARQAPRRLHGLALLGTTARADTPALVALRQQAIALFEQGRMAEVLRANVMFAFHPLHGRNKALVKAYLAMIRRAGAAQLVRQNRAVMAREDLRPFLPAIHCPTLVLCGEADGLTPPEHAREIAALLPQARLEIVPGAGHMLTMEEPGRVNALLSPWLKGLLTPSAAPVHAPRAFRPPPA